MAYYDEKIPYEDNLHTTQNQHGNSFSSYNTTSTIVSDNEIPFQAQESSHQGPPPDYSHPQLPRPIAVPQIVAGIGKPFARIYAPALSDYNLTSQEFVDFIDNLNIVASENPPVQITDLVGDALNTISYHWAQLTESGVQIPTHLGSAAVTKSRTDTYMQNANTKLFAPRGLKASIATMEAMAAVLQLPPDTLRLVAVTDEDTSAAVLERRMSAVRPYVMETTFDVPPATQTNEIAQMSAAQVERQIFRNEYRARREGDKMTAKSDKRENKAQRKIEKVEREMRRLDLGIERSQRELGDLRAREPDKKADKTERKLGKERRKLEDARGKLGYTRGETDESVSDGGREGRRESEDSRLKDRKAYKEVRRSMKILWILVENL
ncbi:uncharacterized protein EAF01_005574 [Botrytis porri]|uniref:Uncharacterized protein n=1 Tax=Botrytis porri TaxID=87229 RepID=A0A4Z1KLZ7_9HELO|nr:uncharacterized protein EAF01_005574 [Botrytis porri]KAF7905053.1 hypothetical protein EAF01_005574 [Botrytis porri]TGO82409.1 hypothetical protein BPOR_0837g00040 [Botrytis porri]